MQELALQGTLFGLEPVEQGGRETAKTKAPSREASCDPLDEAALTEDATRRPRQRQQHQQPSPAEATASSSSATDSDLPPWHHHSLVEPDQLTPMLRHYVQLKAPHP
ncbi:MAG: DNA mismatch repair protein MutS, partial [Vulcanococcus sp.]